jgi:hypothetical protein
MQTGKLHRTMIEDTAWWLNDWEERLRKSGRWPVAVIKIRRRGFDDGARRGSDSGQTAGQVGFCTRIERMKRGGTKRTEKRSHDCLPHGSPPALDIRRPCTPTRVSQLIKQRGRAACVAHRPGTLCVSTTASLGATAATSWPAAGQLATAVNPVRR